MPQGYRPRVPLQRINTPWLSDNGNSDSNQYSLRYPVDTSTVSRNAVPESSSMNLPATSGISLNNVNKPGINWKSVAGKAQSIGNSVAPFISNIANAFRKPPAPKIPYLNSFTNLSKINLDDERARIGRAVSSADVSADRNLSSNTAAAVKSANLGTKLNQLSSVSERESNANAGIANQQAQMDAQTSAGNNNKLDEYNESLTERQIAQQREQSQNFSNAADKYVAIRNEKDKANVDLQKTQMMAHAFDNSQVMGRLRWKAKLAGEVDPLGRNYSDLTGSPSGIPVFKMGGRIPMKRLI